MKICVFCGSGFGVGDGYRQTAAALGRWIAENGHELVYGGGESGLMGVVAEEAFNGGSHVTGVLPGDVPFICGRPQPWCSEVLTMPDMSERKRKMMELSDAFVALPGGTGTLDELSESVTLTKIGVFDKKTVLLGPDGFWEPLRLLLNNMTAAGFIAEGSLDHVLFADDPDQMTDFLAQN